MKLGNITDIHGKDPERALEEFNGRRVDAILLNGDIGSDKSSIEEVIGAFEESNSEVYIIPGSHEPRTAYKEAMKEATSEHEHIIDMNEVGYRKLEGDISLISYGGSRWSPRDNKDPFQVNLLLDTPELAALFHKSRDSNIILQTHEPPKGYGDVAKFLESEKGRVPLKQIEKHPRYDKIKEKISDKVIEEHVGDEDLSDLIEGKLGTEKKPTLATFGHIHEAYLSESPGIEIGSRKEVGEKASIDNLAHNPGAYEDGRFSIVEVDDKASYEIIDLKS